MSKLIDKLNFRNYFREMRLVIRKFENGRIAICVERRATGSSIIMKEFKGEDEYYKWLMQACLMRSVLKGDIGMYKQVNACLSSFLKFLEQKDEVNDEKIY